MLLKLMVQFLTDSGLKKIEYKSYPGSLFTTVIILMTPSNFFSADESTAVKGWQNDQEATRQL